MVNHFLENLGKECGLKIHSERANTMSNGKKALISLFAIFMIIVFCQFSYSQEKPSEAKIKKIIINGYSKSINSITKNNPNLKVSDLKFDSFKITKGFVSKKPGKVGESARYNIEVNYKVSYIESQNLAKWKADRIKQYENNIVMIQQALKAHEAAASKPQQLIEFDKKAINGNKQNIEAVKKFPDIKREKKVIVKNNDHMNFVKKGNKWYGYLGWK
jgi:hypothetical protein